MNYLNRVIEVSLKLIAVFYHFHRIIRKVVISTLITKFNKGKNNKRLYYLLLK